MDKYGWILDKLHIDRRFLKPKIIYFFVFSAQVSLIPFSVIYFKGLGISEELIGVLGAIPPWMAFLGAPVWTAIADKFDIHKYVMLGCFFVTTLFGFSMYLTDFLPLLLALIIGSSFLDAPVYALLDNAVMDMLGDHKDRYGQQRLWGAVGFGLVAPIVGGLIVYARMIGVMFYSYAFWRMATFLVLLTLEVRPSDMVSGFRENLKYICMQPRILSFLVTIFIIGVNIGVLNTFLFLYLQALGGDELLLGLTVLVTCTAEVLYFLFAGKVQALIGHAGVLYASLLAFIARFMLYSFLTNAWYVLFIEVLHGLTFGGMWSSSVAYASELAPPGMGATLQGLLTGICFGLGGGAGSLVGGLLYGRIGAENLFRVMAIWSGFGLVFFAVCNFFIKRSMKKTALTTGDSVMTSDLEVKDLEESSDDQSKDKSRVKLVVYE